MLDVRGLAVVEAACTDFPKRCFGATATVRVAIASSMCLVHRHTPFFLFCPPIQ